MLKKATKKNGIRGCKFILCECVFLLTSCLFYVCAFYIRNYYCKVHMNCHQSNGALRRKIFLRRFALVRMPAVRDYTRLRTEILTWRRLCKGRSLSRDGTKFVRKRVG